MYDPLIIYENNLSGPWCRAFLKLFYDGKIASLVVVNDSLDNTQPAEIPNIRKAPDGMFQTAQIGLSCAEVTNTIFLNALWTQNQSRALLYQRYLEVLPRIRKDHRNRYGIYFQSLTCFGIDTGNPINQLEPVIQTWNRGNQRRTALQVSIFDPKTDHSSQRQRGFPCSQQVAIGRTGEDGLVVAGFYSMQYMFQHAYGNYFGLCRLGVFMAKGIGLRLSKIICVVTPPVLGMKKGPVTELARELNTILNDY